MNLMMNQKKKIMKKNLKIKIKKEMNMKMKKMKIKIKIKKPKEKKIWKKIKYYYLHQKVK